MTPVPEPPFHTFWMSYRPALAQFQPTFIVFKPSCSRFIFLIYCFKSHIGDGPTFIVDSQRNWQPHNRKIKPEIKKKPLQTHHLRKYAADVCMMIYYLWHLFARHADSLDMKTEVNEDMVVKCFSQRTRAGCALTDPLRASMNCSNLRVTQRLKLIYPPVKKSPQTWFSGMHIFIPSLR